MARIRSVKPEFWIDRPLARKLSRDARLLYIGMWNLADEHARLGGDPNYIKGQIFPYDYDLDAVSVDKLIDEIASADKVIRYEVDDEPYLFLPTLHKHQRLEADKVPSRLPPPPDPDNTPPRANKSAPRADESARDSDESAPRADSANGQQKGQATPPTQIGADKSARGADESSLLYVAGSRLQVAGVSSLPTATPMGDGDARGADEPAQPAVAPARVPTFKDFWDAYPRKVAKGNARTAWAKAIKSADPDVILAGVAQYQRHCDRTRKAKQYIRYPATWLNGECWDDAMEDATPPDLRLVSNGHQTYRDPDQSVYYDPKAGPR